MWGISPRPGRIPGSALSKPAYTRLSLMPVPCRSYFRMVSLYPCIRPALPTWPRGFSIPALFDQVDHIIVLPTLRTHSGAGFTMGMKIFVGALPQDDRNVMHGSINFHKAIAENALHG